MGILKSTFTVGALTSFSRILGLVREMLQSRLIGAGVAQSAFVIAFAVPNMARKLFGEGALTAAFVPIFKGEVQTCGVAEAAKLARSVMTMVLLLLGLMVVVSGAALLGVLDCATALSPRARLTLELILILLPYMIFICGAAFGMGVLNSLGKFKASSFMPALLNIVWISLLVALFFCPVYTPERRIVIVAFGILFGGFLQMAFMFRAMYRMGVSPRLSFSGWGAEKVRLVWRNLGIGALGAGAIQINYMLDQALAYIASDWAAAKIGFAERLMDLPLGIIGVAFGTVLLPTFAGFFAENDLAGARASLLTAVKSLMFVMIPAAAGLFILAEETTRVVYEGGAFTSLDTVLVARALAVYALGLAFFGFQKAMIPWFQAQKDMTTPLKVSVYSVILNAALNILAVWLLPVNWRHVGLAASTTFCALFGCVLLMVFARRRNGFTGLAAAIGPVLRMVLAALMMVLAIWSLKPLVRNLNSVLALVCEMALGILVYFALAALLLRPELKALRRRKL